MSVRLGIIGLGEAGSAIAAGLRDAGLRGITGADVRAGDPAVRQRAEAAGVTVATSVADLVERSDVVLCLTVASAAAGVAEEAATRLRPGQFYADLNSASPELMRYVAGIVEPTGATFTDGAVTAAVPHHRHQVPVLLSGGGADALAAALGPYGMRLEVIGEEPGQASAVKMFRSLLVKGVEALVLECALGASVYGATDRVLASMAGSLPFDDWGRLADYLLARTVQHGARRAAELRQVAETLTAAGVEPLLATAAADRLRWFAGQDVAARLDGPPRGYADVLAALPACAAGTTGEQEP